MRIKQPRRASLDEVRITREGDTAIIENADPTISTAHLSIGPQLSSMSDDAILDVFNAIIEAQEILASEYDRPLTEIPPGRPQVRYMEGADQWVPRGEVLRCHTEDDEAGELVVYVDDQDLSLREFGRLLTTFAGWGMRIAFVPEDRLAQRPEIEVREPNEGDE
jgi:hypothetical protein